MWSTTRHCSTHASPQALLSIALLLLLCCKPVPAVSWGQRFSGFGHAIKDAALGTADPRLWDIVDSGDTAAPSADTSNSPSGHAQTTLPHSSLQDSGSQFQQQRLAAGLQASTAASPAVAAAAINEAFAHAQQLIDQALTAVLDQRMPGPAEEGFKQALEAFLQAEMHLRDWGLALLNPESSTPSATTAATSTGDQLQQHSVDQLRIVVQQLQVLLPQDVTGAPPTAAYTSCIAASPSSATATAAGSAPHSPADDIVASLTCLEQLTSGLSAAGDSSAAAGAGGSAAAAEKGAGTGEAAHLRLCCCQGHCRDCCCASQQQTTALCFRQKALLCNAAHCCSCQQQATRTRLHMCRFSQCTVLHALHAQDFLAEYSSMHSASAVTHHSSLGLHLTSSFCIAAVRFLSCRYALAPPPLEAPVA
jgi:hypothetical protein